MVDISKHQKFFAGTRAVIVIQAGSGLRMPIPSALPRKLRTKEAAESAGVYVASDVRWHFPVESAGRFTPAVGSLLLDRGDVWTMLNVNTETLETRFACVCRKADLDPVRAVTILLQSPKYARDEDNAPYATWTNEAVNVTAWIEPISLTIGVSADNRRTVQATHRLYTSDGPTPLAGWRAVLGDAVYNIKRTTNPQLAALVICDVVEARSPEEDQS